VVDWDVDDFWTDELRRISSFLNCQAQDLLPNTMLSALEQNSTSCVQTLAFSFLNCQAQDLLPKTVLIAQKKNSQTLAFSFLGAGQGSGLFCDEVSNRMKFVGSSFSI
jgi:hypothetical protein